MSPRSHGAAYERTITLGCSDPDYTDNSLRSNPVRDLVGLARKHMVDLKLVDCAVDGYRMGYHVKAELLAVFDPVDMVVGGVYNKRILVLPEHRGQGLGAEILIRAFETGVMHPSTMNVNNALTAAGRANRIAAHRIAVERAVKAGVDVDYAILADYIDHLADWTEMPMPVIPGLRFTF